MLIYFNLKDAEAACLHYTRGAVVQDDILTDSPSSCGAYAPFAQVTSPGRGQGHHGCLRQLPCAPVGDWEFSGALMPIVPLSERRSDPRVFLLRTGARGRTSGHRDVRCLSEGMCALPQSKAGALSALG